MISAPGMRHPAGRIYIYPYKVQEVPSSYGTPMPRKSL
jgi:hypothetical protein